MAASVLGAFSGDSDAVVTGQEGGQRREPRTLPGCLTGTRPLVAPELTHWDEKSWVGPSSRSGLPGFFPPSSEGSSSGRPGRTPHPHGEASPRHGRVRRGSRTGHLRAFVKVQTLLLWV